MGTSMVGEKGDGGEREDDLRSNPARRFVVARERISLIELFSGGVMTEEVEEEDEEEEEDEAELESGGGEG